MTLTPSDPAALFEMGMQALHDAERAAARADARKQELRAQALRWLQLHEWSQLGWVSRRLTKPDRIHIDSRLLRATTNTWCERDSLWAAAVADHRLYLDRATAYGAINTMHNPTRNANPG